MTGAYIAAQPATGSLSVYGSSFVSDNHYWIISGSEYGANFGLEISSSSPTYPANAISPTGSDDLFWDAIEIHLDQQLLRLI